MSPFPEIRGPKQNTELVFDYVYNEFSLRNNWSYINWTVHYMLKSCVLEAGEMAQRLNSSSRGPRFKVPVFTRQLTKAQGI